MTLALEDNGVIQSFSIPEELFGYTSHALMVPPYPMRSALFLGYGYGNAAQLMIKIWPVGTHVVGVDLKPPIPEMEPDVFFEKSAEDFVRDSEQVYDFVCIDLYVGKTIPYFVFTESFIDNVARITGKLMALNLTFYNWKDANGYGKHFQPDALKTVNHDKVIFMVPKRILAELKH